MKGIISAGDKKTAQAGIEILKNGGNAFDALTSCIFAAHISEPALTSPAGGGFILTNRNNYEFIDFFVNVPLKNQTDNMDFYPIPVDFGSTTQTFHIGCASVAVPGVIKGVLNIHEKYGKLPLADVLQPAVKMAKEGVHLTEFQIYVLRILEPIFLRYDDSKQIYSKGNKIIGTSDLLRNEPYAEFLNTLAKTGENIFYKGEIADKINELSLKNNGLLSKTDLENYQINILKPIKFSFKEYEVITSPPPSLGGILINFTLNLLTTIEKFKWGSYEHLSSLINAMKITQDFRKNEFANFIENNNKDFKDISPEIMKRYINSYSAMNPFGNTTHISIMDEDNNILSCTSSNGEGSGFIIPNTGIMLNNMLGEEDLNPNGFFKWDSGIRLPSMMTPTVVLKNNEPVLVLGSSGSNRIRSALIQTIINHLIYKQNISDAITNPRIHFEGNTVYIEPGYSDNVINVIENELNVINFQEKNLFFGGVQAVTANMQGASDIRRGSYTLCVN